MSLHRTELFKYICLFELLRMIELYYTDDFLQSTGIIRIVDVLYGPL